MHTDGEFGEEGNSTIRNHVVVELGGWYIDLTLNQFAEYNYRVLIEKETGIVGSLLRTIERHGGRVKRDVIKLDTSQELGRELYYWLRVTADNLLSASPAGDH